MNNPQITKIIALAVIFMAHETSQASLATLNSKNCAEDTQGNTICEDTTKLSNGESLLVEPMKLVMKLDQNHLASLRTFDEDHALPHDSPKITRRRYDDGLYVLMPAELYKKNILNGISKYKKTGSKKMLGLLPHLGLYLGTSIVGGLANKYG